MLGFFLGLMALTHPLTLWITTAVGVFCAFYFSGRIQRFLAAVIICLAMFSVLWLGRLRASALKRARISSQRHGGSRDWIDVADFPYFVFSLPPCLRVLPLCLAFVVKFSASALFSQCLIRRNGGKWGTRNE